MTSTLEKNKLIRTMVPQAAGVKGVPKKIVVLTERGLQEIERFQKKLIKYELDPFRIRQTHIRHSVLGQQATANMLGPDFEFQTERELASMSLKNVKQPDILWLINGRRVSVEVELTSKWDRHLDQFVLSTILSLVSTEETPARFDTVLVLTDSPAIQNRYRAQFEPGAKFNRWLKEGPENTSKWKIYEELTVPKEIEGKVVCQLFESF